MRRLLPARACRPVSIAAPRAFAPPPTLPPMPPRMPKDGPGSFCAKRAANGNFSIVKKKKSFVFLRKRQTGNHALIAGFKAERANYVARIRKECPLVEKGA